MKVMARWAICAGPMTRCREGLALGLPAPWPPCSTGSVTRSFVAWLRALLGPPRVAGRADDEPRSTDRSQRKASPGRTAVGGRQLNGAIAVSSEQGTEAVRSDGARIRFRIALAEELHVLGMNTCVGIEARCGTDQGQSPVEPQGPRMDQSACHRTRGLANRNFSSSFMPLRVGFTLGMLPPRTGLGVVWFGQYALGAFGGFTVNIFLIPYTWFRHLAMAFWCCPEASGWLGRCADHLCEDVAGLASRHGWLDPHQHARGASPSHRFSARRP